MNDQLHLSGKSHSVYQRELSSGEVAENQALAELWAHLTPTQKLMTRSLGKSGVVARYTSNKARKPATDHPWVTPRTRDDQTPVYGMSETRVNRMLGGN
jgi:hypothetical protein